MAAEVPVVFDEEELRAMSPQDRIRLLHALAEIDGAGWAGGCSG